MRTLLLFVLSLTMVAGCARKSPPPAVVVPAPVLQTQLATAPPPDAVHQGLTPTQWERKLLDSPDQATRYRASLALRDLGEPGYAGLLIGMTNKSPDVRLASLQALSRPMMMAHKQQVRSKLEDLLRRDANASVRRHAAGRLAWLGKDAQPSLRSLKDRSENDEDPEVRKAAMEAARDIEITVTGKNPDYKKPGPK